MAWDLEEALFYKLSHAAGVIALCGKRIYPQDLPAKVILPAIRYSLIDDPIEATHDETAGASLAHPRCQFDAYGGSFAQAKELARAIHMELHAFHGTITDGTNSFVIQSCLRVDKRPDKDPETGLYWRSQDYVIWATE